MKYCCAIFLVSIFLFLQRALSIETVTYNLGTPCTSQIGSFKEAH